MRVRAASLIVAGLVAVLSGCSTGRYESDFPVIVVNRTANTIQVIANGNEIGQVATGQTGTFSLHLPETSSNTFTNGVAPTPQAEVVFSARDMRTGAISTTKSVTLAQNPPTYVTFSATDFPAATRTLAAFSASPTNPGVNQDVFFNASASTGSGLTYIWDFGDGRGGAGVTATHQYSQTGTFTVLLTVTSDSGQTATQSRAITVSANLPPTAAIFNFSPTAPAINQDVLFTVATAAPGQTFTWNFGDGSTGSGATITHRFVRASNYTVTLVVSNNIGQSASSSRVVPVAANLPAGSVNFTFSPTDPGVNDTVFFNASATTVANATFSWDFGDGSRGSGVAPSHQYTLARTYTVTLTVTNDLGQSASLPKTVAVSGSSAITADFTFSPTDPSLGLGTAASVIFDATPSSAGVTAWAWDFGDGSSGSGQRLTHNFTRVGTWVVRLTVTDAAGRTATTTKSVTVRS